VRFFELIKDREGLICCLQCIINLQTNELKLSQGD